MHYSKAARSAKLVTMSMFIILMLASTITTIKAAAQPIPSSPQEIVFASWDESGDKILARRSTDGESNY